MKKNSIFHKLPVILYFGIFLIIGLSMLIYQPFGNPPDEYNRILIPQYLLRHHCLPNGYDEEIRIFGYGFSYGFQPILPYMLQALYMQIASLFSDTQMAMVYAGRALNLTLGMINAWIVLLLGREWFTDHRFGFLFSCMASFLPQSIFVHTYINTDSCCLLSISIMLLAMTRGVKQDFTWRRCVFLSVGIILCALSYYNAYGYILSCILLFIFSFLRLTKKSISFDLRCCLKKGLFISALVLAGISWWFIRSYVLYDGDFLGLKSRDACAMLYATSEYHPLTRSTWQNRGESLLRMIFTSDFMNLSLLSFIGIYGAMAIVTSIWVYRFYKLLFLTGITLCVILPSAKTGKQSILKGVSYPQKLLYHSQLLFNILTPLLLSIWYSYTTDYQPQGRYLLPALLPFCAYCIHGIEKGTKWNLFSARMQKILTNLAVAALLLIIVLSLSITVYGFAFPYYKAHPVA